VLTLFGYCRDIRIHCSNYSNTTTTTTIVVAATVVVVVDDDVFAAVVIVVVDADSHFSAFVRGFSQHV